MYYREVKVKEKSELVGQILLGQKLITREQLSHALKLQQQNHQPLGQVLTQCGYITEGMFLRALAARLNVRPWDLSIETPYFEAFESVPIELCRKHRVIPVRLRGDLLLLAMSDPSKLYIIDEFRKVTGFRIEPLLAMAPRIDAFLNNLDNTGRDNTTIDELVNKAMKEVHLNGAVRDGDQHHVSEHETRPVVGLVNRILLEATRMKASDIHIEPRANEVEIRYRLDGQLRVIDSFPRQLLPMVVTRLKIMAEIDIVEFRIPQDGRMGLKIDDLNIDIRMSVLPNYHGPRIVMRILDRSMTLKKLTELGFSDHNLKQYRQLITKPYGMVLMTGPTGSGKTTSLYAALQELKNDSINIMTCEDPIEYDLSGINQSQVNEKVGLTFAGQLRSILRQDPDVILIGEIRDEETAEIAMRASMTGHLVLSTLHTNDALGAVPRLQDIGLKPYLLSTSLIGIAAQRLARTLCTCCKEQVKPTSEEIRLVRTHLGKSCPEYLFKAVGCQKCHFTGYKGRVAINEFLTIDSHLASLIASNEPTHKILEAALASGFVPMQVDALERVVLGHTDFAEIKRTVFFDSEDVPDLSLAA